MDETLKIVDGHVVSMQYTLHVDGEVMDQSEEGEPLEFIQGEGHIIPGLENALYGMAIGESKNVVVPAGEGYGTLDEEAFVEIPRDQFPAEIPLEVGLQLQVRSQDGETMPARIVQVTEDTVRLDFNHPLAGKQLTFDIKIVGVRPATAEEMEHGHVHGQHDHDHDHECECDCEGEEDCDCGDNHSCNCGGHQH